MILLDTNVISELVRPAPNPAVIAYLRTLAPDVVFTTAICEAEIRYGLARMPAGHKRDELAARIDALFATGFQEQVVPFDGACAALYGEIRASREAAGKPISLEDAMIAATARAHGAVLATRNVGDFADCGTTIINPWIAE